MPATIRKRKRGGFEVRTPGGIKAHRTTKSKASKQKRLLNAIEHGFDPDRDSGLASFNPDRLKGTAQAKRRRGEVSMKAKRRGKETMQSKRRGEVSMKAKRRKETSR